MTNLLWNKTQTQIVLDGMNGLSVVSKFQKIYRIQCPIKEGVPEIHQKDSSVF